MTPADLIEFLMRATRPVDGGVPLALVEMGLFQGERLALTPRGQVFLEMLCGTPLPEYRDPRANPVDLVIRSWQRSAGVEKAAEAVPADDQPLCLQCRGHLSRFCSQACADKYHSKPCRVCGKAVPAEHDFLWRGCCSQTCMEMSNARATGCRLCGGPLPDKDGLANREGQYPFCSEECARRSVPDPVSSRTGHEEPPA